SSRLIAIRSVDIKKLEIVMIKNLNANVSTPSRRDLVGNGGGFLAAATLMAVSTATVRADQSSATGKISVAEAGAATHYRTEQIKGIDISYREAGPKDGPAVLLLHGFPSSSRMFRGLIPDKYRLIAPDYPAFGHSATPSRAEFTYNFANIADVV